MSYDSSADTLKHSLRVGALMGQAISELVDRSVRHDLSKTEPPELEIFNEFTPKLKTSTYGSDEYKGFLEAMGTALQHHYAMNRHHPEHFGAHGINGMTLVDLIEMLADWKAATERHDDGNLAKSLEIQQERFGISDQLAEILHNTAEHFGWIPLSMAQEAPEAADTLAEVEPCLLDALRELGRTYGPLGVALAAARLTDPSAVVRELASARQPASEQEQG